MSFDVPLACACGTVTGRAHLKPSGRHLVCHCNSCQAFAHFLGHPGMLDEFGGTEIYQLTPAQIQISQGQDSIACVKLSDKGILRWYTACCRTPVSNTLAGAKIPFAGMPVAFIALDDQVRDSILGPIQYRIHGRDAPPHQGKDESAQQNKPLPNGIHSSGPPGLIIRTIFAMARNAIKGLSQPSPFFSASGEPIAAAQVLTAQERLALNQPRIG